MNIGRGLVVIRAGWGGARRGNVHWGKDISNGHRRSVSAGNLRNGNLQRRRRREAGGHGWDIWLECLA